MLNGLHWEYYEWSERLEVNKSCAEATPLLGNLGAWRVDVPVELKYGAVEYRHTAAEKGHSDGICIDICLSQLCSYHYSHSLTFVNLS